jgi:hypothetical protein
MKSLTHRKMDQNPEMDGVAALLLTFFLYVFSLMTAAEWASVMAIFAGLSAGLYNGYKFILMFRNNRRKKKPGSNG